MERVLEGNLARFEVPDILTFLNMGRRTGVLVLERPDLETKIFFRDGRPIFATTTKEELRLGAMLVRAGKVRQEQMERLLAQQRTRGYRIGQILLAEKVLSEEELATLLKVQVSEVIFDTFTGREGTFVFYDKVTPPATAVTLEMDLQNLIMEGVRRLDERARLSEVFPDLNMVVEAVSNPERVKFSATLTPDEWKIFFLVDGRRTISEICRLEGGADELTTLQILHNLLRAKFVNVVPASAPAAQAPAPVMGDPEGTQKMVEGRTMPPAMPVSVEFNPATRPPRVEDDTAEIVRPQAVPYMADAKGVMVSRLILVKDGDETSFPLTRDTYTLGRHRNNDIVVNDPKVSSFHARLDRTPEGFVLVDLQSRNGSFLNGKRVTNGLLKTGDELRLGTARLLYKVDYTSSV